MMFIYFSILKEVLFLDFWAVILRLLSSDSGIDGKKGIQRNVLLSTFVKISSLSTTNATDVSLVPNGKAELHPKGLDQRKKDLCSGILYIPESLCLVQVSFIFLYEIMPLWYTTCQPRWCGNCSRNVSDIFNAKCSYLTWFHTRIFEFRIYIS